MVVIDPHLMQHVVSILRAHFEYQTYLSTIQKNHNPNPKIRASDGLIDLQNWIHYSQLEITFVFDNF